MEVINSYKLEKYSWEESGIEMCKYFFIPITLTVFKSEKGSEVQLIFWN